MEANAIQKIENLVLEGTCSTELNGFHYKRRDFSLIKPPKAETLQLNSLSGLIDYVKMTATAEKTDKPDFILIDGLNGVKLCTDLNSVKEREIIANVSSGGFPYYDVVSKATGKHNYFDADRFNICLQSLFEQDAYRSELLSIVSNVDNQESINQQDNGSTQTVTVKQGIRFVGEKDIPNPVKLAPFTYPDIEPVSVEYVIRARKSGSGGVEFAMFECDGGKWITKLNGTIADFLKGQLPNTPIIW